MIVSIHQPNLFPWLGFFHKIHSCDVFVYLNHTENNPRTAIYTKRVKLLVNKQEFWLTCSLKNDPGIIFQPINKMTIEKPDIIKDKHLKTIELNYKKAPFFKDVFYLIENFYNHKSSFISERNIDFIEEVCDVLFISTKRVLSSELNLSSQSTQLLIDITKKLNGKTYLAGGGASGYQEDSLFQENGIQLSFQNFKHPTYQQLNSQNFISGLSIIDALMNLGFQNTAQLIKDGSPKR